MPRIIVTEPEDFPDPSQAKFFQNLRLLMRVKLTPGAIDLDGRVDGMRAEALIGFGDVFVTLLTDAVHPGSLLSALPHEGPFGYNSRMILAEIQQYIEDHTHGEVLYPCYESYSLSKIPSAVLALLGIPQPDHALLKIVRADRSAPTGIRQKSSSY